MRSACHVSCLSPSSASTSKYSPIFPHRAPQRQHFHGAGKCRQTCWSQQPQTSHSHAAAADKASTLQQNLEGVQVTTIQPAVCHKLERASVWNTQRLARCTAHGFAAAALLTFVAPGPSYSAESLPIEFLRTWVVSTASHVQQLSGMTSHSPH